MELYLSQTNLKGFASNKRVIYQNESRSNLSSPRLCTNKSSQLSSSGRMLDIVSKDIHNLGDIKQTVRLLQRGLRINSSSFSRQEKLEMDMKYVRDFQSQLRLDSQKKRLEQIQKELNLL